jgi:2'-5' RNA ligase
MKKIYSLWILPPKKLSKEIIKENKKLYEKYGSEELIPHITLLPVLEGEINQINAIISDSIKEFKDINITLEEIEIGKEYWKSIFVNIKENKELNSLFQELYSNLNNYLQFEPGMFHPHISILYSEFEPEKLNKVKELINLDLFNQEFKVKKIYLMKTTTDKAIDWEICSKFNLE